MKMKVLRMNIESSNTVFVNTSTFFALIQKHISENGPLFSIETESLNNIKETESVENLGEIPLARTMEYSRYVRLILFKDSTFFFRFKTPFVSMNARLFLITYFVVVFNEPCFTSLESI